MSAPVTPPPALPPGSLSSDGLWYRDREGGYHWNLKDLVSIYEKVVRLREVAPGGICRGCSLIDTDCLWANTRGEGRPAMRCSTDMTQPRRGRWAKVTVCCDGTVLCAAPEGDGI